MPEFKNVYLHTSVYVWACLDKAVYVQLYKH